MTDPHDLQRIARRFASSDNPDLQRPRTDWTELVLNVLACVGVVWFMVSLAQCVAHG